MKFLLVWPFLSRKFNGICQGLPPNCQIRGHGPPVYFVTKKHTTKETQMREKVANHSPVAQKKSLTNYTLPGAHFSASRIQYRSYTRAPIPNINFITRNHIHPCPPPLSHLSNQKFPLLRTRTAPHKQSAKKAAKKKDHGSRCCSLLFLATFPVFILYFTYSELKRSRIHSRRKNYIRVYIYTDLRYTFFFFFLIHNHEHVS